MNSILDEVLLDQHEEKKVRFLKLLLPIVIIISIIGAALIFGYNWKQNRTKTTQMRLGDILVKTITDGRANSEIFDYNILNYIINKNEGKISELAALKQVALKIVGKDSAEAKKLLEEIINNANYDIVTLSFARIVWLAIEIDKEDLLSQDKEKLENFLRYFENEKQPFFGVAGIFKALWYIKNNQPSLAQDILKSLVSTKSISDNIKELAYIMLSNLAHKGDL